MYFDARKGYQLKYELTDLKLREAVRKLVASGKDPTVRMVAEKAGVSVTTAYSHKVQDMILDEVFKKAEAR